MSQKKDNPVWSNVEDEVIEAMDKYMIAHDQSMSEFVRICIAEKLLREKYLEHRQLETILYGT